MRKRLVPFLLAPDSTTSSTNNTGTFEPISESLKSQLTTRDYSGLASTATLARIMTGAQVYADLASSKSIGEVVHVDSTGTIGVAMLQQAALVNSQGNFIVRPRPVEATGGELEVEVGGELPAQSSGSSPSEGEPESAAAPAVFDANAPVSYISTYRPDWFQGLDERTGNVLDL